MSYKRILIRSGKEPTSIVGYEDTLDKNVLGTNSGNLIFAHSVFKTLGVKGTELKSTKSYRVSKYKADQVSSDYDAFVIPLANAFRPSFISELDEYSAFIEKLKIPVVVTGVGAQGTLDYDTSRLKDSNKSVKRFVKAVLNKSSSIGVRGECTFNYLKSLGFSNSDVDIIGCPSMFLNGPDLILKEKAKDLSSSSKVAINVSPYVPNIGDTFEYNRKIFNNLTYIPQNNESLEQLLWGAPEVLSKKNIPHNIHHPMYKNDQIKFFIDPSTWIEYLKDYDFSFGTRIHGTVMAILSGTPSFLLAHDSRTLELAEYFEIPHARYDSFEGPISGVDLFSRTDSFKMVSGHRKRFDKYIGFLEKNNLPHVFSKGQDEGVSFEKKISSINFPEAVCPPSGNSLTDAFSRVAWVNSRLTDKVKKLEKRIKTLES